MSEGRKQTCEEGRKEDVCMIRGREGETIRVRYYSRAPEVEIRGRECVYTHCCAQRQSYSLPRTWTLDLYIPYQLTDSGPNIPYQFMDSGPNIPYQFMDSGPTHSTAIPLHPHLSGTEELLCRPWTLDSCCISG